MNNKSPKKMAMRIKELRAEKGITQKELAANIGLSCGTIVGYENSQREPNSRAMAQLETFFNVSGSFLRGETDVKEQEYIWQDAEVMDAVSESFSPMLAAILGKVKSCSAEEQKLTFDILLELKTILSLGEPQKAKRTVSLSSIHDTLANTNDLIKALESPPSKSGY